MHEGTGADVREGLDVLQEVIWRWPFLLEPSMLVPSAGELELVSYVGRGMETWTG